MSLDCLNLAEPGRQIECADTDAHTTRTGLAGLEQIVQRCRAHLDLVAYVKPQPRLHIILDNYGIHDSQQVQLALKSATAEKLELHLLPPYCPDHNRIERVWKDLHDYMTRNHRCSGMEEIMTEVRLYLIARNQRGRHTYARDSAA